MPSKLPPLPVKAPGRPGSPRYREQYGVIVICESENHQRLVYEALATTYKRVRVVRT
jgi:hypothetical protein